MQLSQIEANNLEVIIARLLYFQTVEPDAQNMLIL